MTLDMARATIPAQGAGPDIPLGPHPRTLPDRTRCADPKPRGRLAA